MRKILLLAAVVATTAVDAGAQDWPSRPLTMVVAYAPGGPSDIVARVVASGMSQVLGQPIVVENVPGAGGMIGAARIAHAAPDGYQFLAGAAGVLAQNQSLYKRPMYNSRTDFAPVGLIATNPFVLVTRKDFPADNLREFIAYAKSHEGSMQFGSPGAGSGPHITCVLLNAAIGVSVVHIPYRDSSMLRPDLMAGRFDYMCDPISTALPQVEAKAVKAIATLTRERAQVLPQLATAAEQGLEGFDAPGWYAFVLPKGTPDTVVRRLNRAMNEALDRPAVRDRLTQLGNTVPPQEQRTPEYLAKFIPGEIEKWAAPVKASGVSMD